MIWLVNIYNFTHNAQEINDNVIINNKSIKNHNYNNRFNKQSLPIPKILHIL